MTSYQIDLIRFEAVRVRIEASDDGHAHHAWHDQPETRAPAHGTSVRTIPAVTSHRNRSPQSGVTRSPTDTGGINHDD